MNHTQKSNKKANVNYLTKNKKTKKENQLNAKTFELNVTANSTANKTSRSGKQVQEGYSRKLETIKLDSPLQEEVESLEEEDDHETEETTALIAQIPNDSDELMAFTQNLKMDEYPTEFLVELAERLKNRRENVYKEYEKPEETGNVRKEVVSRGNNSKTSTIVKTKESNNNKK